MSAADRALAAGCFVVLLVVGIGVALQLLLALVGVVGWLA